jgi:hypothetical protein
MALRTLDGAGTFQPIGLTEVSRRSSAISLACKSWACLATASLGPSLRSSAALQTCACCECARECTASSPPHHDSIFHTVTQSFTLSLNQSHCHSIIHTVTQSFTLSLNHSHCHSIVHTVTQSFTLSLNRSHCHSIVHTVTQSFTPSLNRSHCHSIVHTVTQSFTLSLNQSHSHAIITSTLCQHQHNNLSCNHSDDQPCSHSDDQSSDHTIPSSAHSPAHILSSHTSRVGLFVVSGCIRLYQVVSGCIRFLIALQSCLFVRLFVCSFGCLYQVSNRTPVMFICSFVRLFDCTRFLYDNDFSGGIPPDISAMGKLEEL